MERKYLYLLLLCLQNASYTLLRRYSVGILQESVRPSTILLASEVVKLVISSAMVEAPGKTELQANRISTRLAAVRAARQHSLAMLVPAVVYLAMNMMSLFALQRIDGTTFSMLAQLKTLTTAISATLVLARRFSLQQWRSMVSMTLSVTIITYQAGQQKSSAANGADSLPNSSSLLPYAIGVGLVLLEITLSGWISVYFEKYLKDGTSSIWTRNLQLSGWSFLIYFVIEARYAASSPTESFSSWSIFTLLVVFLGSCGGLLVALTTKHADAVMKTMATAAALVLIFFCEVALFGKPHDMVIVMASVLVLISLQSYHEASQNAAVASQKDASSTRIAAAVHYEVVPESKSIGQPKSEGEEHSTVDKNLV